MSSKQIAIKVQGLSKCFKIYDRPRDRLKQLVLPGIQKIIGREATVYHREFWALDSIDFEVERGQTVGIIGQNGSGKSTLLQIITGTMAPTHGTVTTNGRVAALLELGSGFNPDFTGRENVYLNGSLLGLTRTQIDEKFDYILSFSEIGSHIDQAVKTYSSGMMLRLAFAVQVAVETEILIIDEALAVGDARFQSKCFKRLEELKNSGTTILFVSHSTELVKAFCDFGLVLDKGKKIYWGGAKSAAIKYLATIFPDQTQPETVLGSSELDATPQSGVDNQGGYVQVVPDHAEIHTFGVGGATLEWLRVYGLQSPNMILGGQELKVCCRFSWDIDFIQGLIAEAVYPTNITLGVTLADKKGAYLFGCNGFDCEVPINCLELNYSVVEFIINIPYLAEGDYFMAVAIALGEMKHHVQLRWYDGLLHLRCIEGDKKVFGLVGVDYKMNLIA